MAEISRALTATQSHRLNDKALGKVFRLEKPGPSPLLMFTASIYSTLESKHYYWLKMVKCFDAANQNPSIPAWREMRQKLFFIGSC